MYALSLFKFILTFFFNLKVNSRRGWFELKKKCVRIMILGRGVNVLEDKFVRSGMLKREENAGPTFGTADRIDEKR